MTWYELKTFCNSLNGDQLGQEVLIKWDKLLVIVCGKFLLEDDYIDPSGDFIEPRSRYKDEPEILESEEIIVQKGQPILIID